MTKTNKYLVIIEKIKKHFFVLSFRKKTSNVISKLNDDFSEDFFEVLHIYVDPKVKILESHFNFCDFFSKNVWLSLKSSNFELEKHFQDIEVFSKI